MVPSLSFSDVKDILMQQSGNVSWFGLIGLLAGNYLIMDAGDANT